MTSQGNKGSSEKGGQPRILGLTLRDTRWDDGQNSYVGKLANVFNALGNRFDLVGLENAEMPVYRRALNLLANFNPDRNRWYIESMMRPEVIRQRTRALEPRLKKLDGQYDLIFQLQSLMAPGDHSAKRPYVVCTDNTYALSARHWPAWLPLDFESEQKAWKELEGEIYRNARYVFTWSEFARQSVIEDYDISENKVVATGAGANFISDSIDNQRYDSQTAIFVGLSFERKGGYVLLESWKEVQKELPNSQLLIVGATNQTKDDIPGIRWLGRVADRQELRRLYSLASVFVMPSIFEPWGHVFTEAMGMGLTCIGNNSCAMPEIITHNETGLLVTPGSVEELSEALIRTLADPDLASRLGHQAHRKIVTTGKWSDTIDNMSEYILKAASE